MRLGKTAELIVGELHGRFYETTYRGAVYSGGMQLTSVSNATFTLATATSGTLATAATATPIIGLYNPSGSSVNAVVLQATVSMINTALQETGAGSLVWLAWNSQSALTLGSLGWARSRFVQTGSQCKTLAGEALTGLSSVQSATTNIFATSAISPGAISNLSTLQTAAGLITSGGSPVENIDGSIIVPPGGLLALFATTTPVAWSASSSILWEGVAVKIPPKRPRRCWRLAGLPLLLNFSPTVKAWLLLITLVLGTGIGVGVTAYLGGAHWLVAALCGLGTGATNVYHALSESPKDKATKPPFPVA